MAERAGLENLDMENFEPRQKTAKPLMNTDGNVASGVTASYRLLPFNIPSNVPSLLLAQDYAPECAIRQVFLTGSILMGYRCIFQTVQIKCL